ncbi:phosphoprotein [New Minto virus]|uniref:Phosphoprotein n=1 Tax=New Minto virus TaxID=1272952 RepID=A0A0D3R1T6_9RHAB|nr:phosphoprotein [New Minto virus]AJR28477.1 phosphoprotein [New Minto virus]
MSKLDKDLLRRMASGFRATLAAGTDEDPSLGPSLSRVERPEVKTWQMRPYPEIDDSEDEELDDEHQDSEIYEEDDPLVLTKGDSPLEQEEATAAGYQDYMDELVGKMGGFDMAGYLGSGNGTHKCAEYKPSPRASQATLKELRRFTSFLQHNGFIKHADYTSRSVTVYGTVRKSPPESPAYVSPATSVHDMPTGSPPLRVKPLPSHNPTGTQRRKVNKLIFGYILHYKTPRKTILRVDPSVVCQENGCTMVTSAEEWLEHHRSVHTTPHLEVVKLLCTEPVND